MSSIRKDLQELTEAGLISTETAYNIEAYYASRNRTSPNRLFTVFGVLGALLVGLGIILILAHNWDNFSKSIQTVFAFTPLVIGQVLVGFSIVKKKNPPWLESSGTFLFFAVGACIALVGQIYNLPGKLSAFLLTWILLCAPLIYILRSKALVLLHLIFVTYYACAKGYFMSHATEPWLYFVLLAIPLPYYFQKIQKSPHENFTSVLHFLFPLSICISLGTFITSGSIYFGFFMYLICFCVFYLIGKQAIFEKGNRLYTGYTLIGSLGVTIMLLIASFRWFWVEVPEDADFSHTAIIAILLFIIGIGLFIGKNRKSLIKPFNLFEYMIFLTPSLFFLGPNPDWLGTVLSNVIVLALGISAILLGVRRNHFGILNYGLLIITALITCRFFDTNMSFVVRGLLFVLVGVGFFISNYIMLKNQKSNV